MNTKINIQTIMWSLLSTILFGICIYEYFTLSYNLQSIYDEGFFFITSCKLNDPIAFTQPLSLSVNLINALIPNIDQYDILSLRQDAFIAKGISLLVLFTCSCIYLYKRYNERHLYAYLTMLSSYLLIATILLPSIVFNMNDLMLILTSFAFSLCLIYSITEKKVIQYFEVVLIGVVSCFTLLCNLPAGCMMIVLCLIYLGIYKNFNIRQVNYILVFGILGIIIGFLITHIWVISLQDCLEFMQKGITQTTTGGRASHHSLSKIILVIFLGLRDLTITVLILCGLTYICKIIHNKVKKDWLTIISILILFLIVYKWQVKPQITITSIMCWLTILFLDNQFKNRKLKVDEILLIVFSLVLPIGMVFGTNTSIIVKALLCSGSWGFLIFYLYYLTNSSKIWYALVGYIIVICSVLNKIDFCDKSEDVFQFSSEKSIARMNLTKHQKKFYDEVYDVITEKGFVSNTDTMLGFCFNEMTIVAMNAVPYTNDQQPEEFLLHDLNILPSPKFMILSEWDSVVLYSRLVELNWNFPDSYDYYKCRNNPDPNSKYDMTQSIIYCRKD